jgi:hypothetical protein
MNAIEEQRLLELWEYQPAIRKLANRVCGPHRKHHQEDLEAHCYTELTRRIGQYKGEAPIWAWAKRVLQGVTADWLKERIAEETLVAESNGADPNTRPHSEKVWTVGFDEERGGFEDVTIEPVKANKPEGAAPDDDEDLTKWAHGDIKFGGRGETSPDKITTPDDERAELEDAGELPNVEEPEPEVYHPVVNPEQIAEPAPVEVPPTMLKIYCFDCAQTRNVVRQSERMEHGEEPSPKAGKYALENKVSTFMLECTHTREIVKTLKRMWIRPSRATGKPRGRPRRINEAMTI